VIDGTVTVTGPDDVANGEDHMPSDVARTFELTGTDGGRYQAAVPSPDVEANVAWTGLPGCARGIAGRSSSPRGPSTAAASGSQRRGASRRRSRERRREAGEGGHRRAVACGRIIGSGFEAPVCDSSR